MMVSPKRPVAPIAPVEVIDVEDSLRVLSEVVTHLSERVELLEARESLNRLRSLEG